jgi:CDP-diglyceride synthetase
MIKQRLATGGIIGVMALLALLVPGRVGETFFLVLAVGFSSLAVLEFLNLTRSTGLPGYPRTTAATVALLVAVTCFRGMAQRPGLAFTGLWGGVLLEVFIFVVFLIVVVSMVVRSGDFSLNFKRALISVSVLAIVMGTLGFIPRLYFLTPGHCGGRHLLLYLILVTKSADIGAYTVGMTTAKRPEGNHKLVPAISPKKSWEGLAGGTITAILVALIAMKLAPTAQLFGESWFVRIPALVVFGIFCSVTGLFGDLGESLLKRATGAKDSGNLPGLGGVLDVLDSLILATPLFYIYVTINLYQ